MCGIIVLWILIVFVLASIYEPLAIGFVLLTLAVWLIGKALPRRRMRR